MAKKGTVTYTTKTGTYVSEPGKTPVYTPTNTRPDTSRNQNLAGQTVYDDGFNSSYDENGYHTSSVNVAKTGQTRAEKSKDAVLDPSGRDQNKVGDANYTTNEEYDVLKQYGDMWTDAYNRGDKEGMEQAHALAEQFRAQLGYSGGADGSQFIVDRNKNQASSGGGSVSEPVELKPGELADQGSGGSGTGSAGGALSQAPDLTGLLNSWLASAKLQQENKIDYAVQQGVNELQRAEEDAQQQFQAQQNQVSEDERKALDNQALYAEARGDRGGIGQAQYAQIQATAMTNRRAINSARTKLSTDTARQIADLRAQGEFQKADALLELSQTYLGQLMDLEKWGAEYNLEVDKFNAQLQQWEAEFEMAVGEMLGNYKGYDTLNNQKFQTSVDQWNQEFNYTTQQNEREFLANSGLAALAVGIRPSAAQQAAMGYTDAQINAELAAYQLAQAAGVKGSGSGGGGNPTEKAPDVKTDPMGYLNYHQVRTKEQAEAILALTFKEEGHAAMLAEQYAEVYLSDHNYNALLSALAKIESGAAPDRVKIDKIIDEIEKAAKSGKITPDQEMSLLAQYGLG